MPRPIWTGQITFGLVNVPVVLHSAEKRADLKFKLIDSQNSAGVRYERVNEETGEEVPWDRIVKGFEYNDGHYVLFSEEDLKKASVEMTRTIEIEQFVDLDDIPVVYFDRPYYLVPGKGGQKGYVILREAMASANKVGIARVVIRTRQSLCALMPVGDTLVLNLLRFQQELRDADKLDIPSSNLKDAKVTKKEIEMAGQLLEAMTADWDPSQFHDEYHDAVMKLVESRIASGKTEEITAEDEEPEEEQPDTINFMDVLKKSVAESSSKSKTKTAKKSSGRSGSKRKSTKKKSAG